MGVIVVDRNPWNLLGRVMIEGYAFPASNLLIKLLVIRIVYVISFYRVYLFE
jgi:hypothetical protein